MTIRHHTKWLLIESLLLLVIPRQPLKYIPIELISAVYDRFLAEKEKEKERREQGAYYTPMFLADTVISQVWDLIPAGAKDQGRFLDPACGSGVFLVRSFQRLCEHWRETRTSEIIDWSSLLAILSRLNGWDLNRSAVRVAVFSLGSGSF